MYMLDRNQESLGYFSLANSIFDCELGPFHNRTLVSAQNMKKAGIFETLKSKTRQLSMATELVNTILKINEVISIH